MQQEMLTLPPFLPSSLPPSPPRQAALHIHAATASLPPSFLALPLSRLLALHRESHHPNLPLAPHLLKDPNEGKALPPSHPPSLPPSPTSTP